MLFNKKLGSLPTAALLSLLLVSLTNSVVEAQSFFNLTNFYVDGNDIGDWRSAVNEGACEQICRTTPNCVAVSYSYHERRCFLKSQVLGRAPNPTWYDLRYFSKLIDMSALYPARLQRVYRHMPGSEINFNTIFSRSLSNVNECRAECNKTPGCTAFSFNKVTTTNNCHLKTTSNWKSKNSNFDSYVYDVETPARRNYAFNENTSFDDYLGEKLSYFLVPFEDCPSICDQTPRCQAFILHLQFGQGCQLYATPLKSGARKATSEHHAFILSATPSNSYFSIRNLAYKSDASTASADINSCKTTCDNTHGCTWYRFESGRCFTGFYSYIESLIDSTRPITNRGGVVTHMRFNNRDPKVHVSSLASPGKLFVNDAIVSADGKVSLAIQHDRNLIISYNSVRVNVLAEEVISVGATAAGFLSMEKKDRTARNLISVTCGRAPYSLVVGDDSSIKIVSGSCTTFSYSLTADTLPFDTLKDVLADGTTIDSTWGKDTIIYFLDSGVTTDYDVMNTMKDNVVRGATFSNIVSTPSDVWGHGTMLALITKSSETGLAQSSQVISVKITDFEDRFFSEKNLISAIRWVFNHQNPSGLQKIINLSGAFSDGNGNLVNCAIQWAYNAGIPVIQAAGNDGRLLANDNGYQFVVGSFDPRTKTSSGRYSTWSLSNHGSIIDLWAPNMIYSKSKIGTSFATGYVSAVLAASISKYPNLKNKPAQAYQYLIDRASSDLINTADDKAKKSNNLLKALRVGSLQAPSYTAYTKVGGTDFCVGRTWDSLVTAASSTRLGFIVSSTNVQSCDNFLSRDCD
jgi:hypothetical protein